MSPPVRYAPVDGGHLAYLTLGDGPPLVGFPGGMITASALFEEPRCARLIRGVATVTTRIAYDRRGIGHSDPLPPGMSPTIDQQADDLLALLDAIGIERASLSGNAWDAQAVLRFAATHPGRVDKLVLTSTTACVRSKPDYPFGVPEEIVAAIGESLRVPGTEAADVMALMAPSRRNDHGLAAWFAESGRASPSTARAYFEVVSETDVRDDLARIEAPVLILHNAGDPWIRIENARYLAEHLPNAKLIEYEAPDHLIFLGDLDAKIDEINRFIGAEGSGHVSRQLLAVLFTDVVGSTERATAEHDRRWRASLDEVDSAVDRQVGRHGGRVAKNLGDGHLALFERPSDAVSAALSIIEQLRLVDIGVRAGIHFGEVEVREGSDVAGVGVHLAARVSAAAGDGQLLATQTVVDLAGGATFVATAAGDFTLKGFPGTRPLFALTRPTR